MRAVDLLLGLVALLLLVFPGWLLARSRGLALPVLAGFVFGAVVLVALLLGLEACGLPLVAGTLFPGWLALGLAALLASRRSRPAAAQPPAEWWRDWPLLLPVLPALAVVAYRAVAQPLFGIDTVFRWNFLAEQMLARGHLAFYPPATAADYTVYAWPDGIAPVVSALYFWVYALAGAARPVMTAPVVIAQFLLLVTAAYALAKQAGSARAGALAGALVACSPLLLWSTAMGQESGLTTLALLALLLYLPASRETADPAATIAAGCAAALGGLAREYGLAFVLFGLALGTARRLSVRTLGLFLLPTLLGALPWYGRNWQHTGNPFFNLDLAGLFPVNTAHLRLMQLYQGHFGWSELPPEAPRIFLTNCLVAVLGAIAGASLLIQRVRPLLAAMLLMAALWFASLGYTAAGFTYSLRVMAPALALGAVLGGLVLARWVPAQRHLAGLALALLLVAGDAALRTLVLPANLYKVPPAAWLSAGGAVHEYHQRPVYRQLAAFAAERRMLVLGPTALLTAQGAHIVPLWSPEVAYLWDEACPRADALRRLAASGIGLVLVNTGDVNQAYLSLMPFFRGEAGAVMQPIWGDSDMTLFKLAPPAPTAAVK